VVTPTIHPTAKFYVTANVFAAQIAALMGTHDGLPNSIQRGWKNGVMVGGALAANKSQF